MKSPSILLSIVAAVTMTFGLSTSSVYADCPGDLNNNNVVDGFDLTILTTNWGGSGSGDINGDGSVGGADLALLIGHWGSCGFGGPPSVGNTLVIDPSKLGLPAGWSAYVVGYANVLGGCIKNNSGSAYPDNWDCYPFAVTNSSGNPAGPGQDGSAKFENPTTIAGTIAMIKIWESVTQGPVWGTTTITMGDVNVLSGGRLVFIVTPPGAAAPTGIPWGLGTLSGSGPCQDCNSLVNGCHDQLKCITVTEPIGPPIQYPNDTSNPPVMQLFDIVEFFYMAPTGNPQADLPMATWDLSAVNGLLIPMTMTVTGPGAELIGSVGTEPNITRESISHAYNKFIAGDTYGQHFGQLLYWSGGHYVDCFQTPTPIPGGQFFAIPSAWQWLSAPTGSNCSQCSDCDLDITSLNNYWNAPISSFFAEGNTLKVVTSIDSQVEYTGTCNLGVYHFVRTIPDPNNVDSFTVTAPSQADSAKYVFGNAAVFPVGPAGLVINQIMEALNRGVYLDGFWDSSNLIQISTATSTGFYQPPPMTTQGQLPNPLGVATITTLSNHGIPIDPLPKKLSYRAHISGVTAASPPGAGCLNVANYNGVVPIVTYLSPCPEEDATCEAALTVTGPKTFQFHYQLDLDGTSNKSTISTLTLGSFTAGIQSVTVTLNTNQRVPTVGEQVKFTSVNCGSPPSASASCTAQLSLYNTTHQVISSEPANMKFNINISTTTQLSNPSPSGGICWSLDAPGTGGTLTPYGASTIAWNNFKNWYGAPKNPSHKAQAYNTYSKFLHYSTINGTDSRISGTPIFQNNQAYGFPLDETPEGPYSGEDVAAKLDGTVPQGSTIRITLTPFLTTP